MTEAQRAAGELMMAEEARVIAALTPLVTGSPHPSVVVAATATVLGRMLGMAHQSGCMSGTLAKEANSLEELMRLGLAHQLRAQPSIARNAGRA